MEWIYIIIAVGVGFYTLCTSYSAEDYIRSFCIMFVIFIIGIIFFPQLFSNF